MKTKYHIAVVAAFVVTALTQAVQAEAPPVFMSQEQVVNWQTERTEKAHVGKRGMKEHVSTQFYTGKPLDGTSDSYLFKFRMYDAETVRWKTTDPSGFPDGANNVIYTPSPLSEFDFQGLKKVAWVVAWTDVISTEAMNASSNEFQAAYNIVYADFVKQDAESSTHYIDDGDSFDFFMVGSPFDFALGSVSSYDRIYLAAHGNSQQQTFFLGSNAYPKDMIWGFGSNIFMIEGCGNGFTTTAQIVAGFVPSTSEFLKE